MSMIDDAKRRAELEARARRAGLEPFAVQMADAVGTDLIRDLVRDSRRQSPHKFDPLPPKPSDTEPKADGDVAARAAQPKPYRLPAGTAVHDRMVDAMTGVTRKREG